MTSPLAKITSVLMQIRESANAYHDTLQNNEAATRAVLIDPLLRALGWETENPFMVEVEKKLDQSRFDYALLDVNQEIKTIVEAKKLGVTLDDPEIHMSLVKYAFSAELQNIFLTDGIIWHHFTKFQPEDKNPQQVLSLRDDNPTLIASYFIQNLDAAKYWTEVDSLTKVSQDIRQLRGELNTLQAKVETLTNPKPDFLSDAVSSNEMMDQRFTQLSALGQVAYTKPSHLRLPDGIVVDVKTWTDVLVHSCNYVLRFVHDLTIPFKDRAGKKTNLLSRTRPPLGISYYEIEYSGDVLFIYTNYDSNNCVRNSMYILDRLPDELGKVGAAVIFE